MHCVIGSVDILGIKCKKKRRKKLLKRYNTLCGGGVFTLLLKIILECNRLNKLFAYVNCLISYGINVSQPEILQIMSMLTK